ncbi:protein kinase STUNTED-like [Impatiens glandulifera]|uniref:protein kinase STUNTED-like n=1 Tax=Impatiens glandulifera TaxID=253017 RepID=UPI001FB0BFBD|nr:protein kinase STUNTED-like [Impatiens glandulifera]
MKFSGDSTAQKPVKDCTVFDGDSVSSASGGGGGDNRVVLVGVRLDAQSKELLTWALVKVARSGDRVVALHILSPGTEGQSTFVSLVKTFDSMMAAYEGFCNLKQVDLKLKVCRGASARKVLVQEAKSYGGASLILGVSRVHHRIRSQLSVAKYCAKHLPKTFSVLAVDNGKIMFEHVADDSIVPSLKDDDSNKQSSRKLGWSLSKKRKESDNDGLPNTNSTDEPCTKVSKENPLSMVVVKNKQISESTHGWSFIRKMILQNKNKSDESSSKKTIIQRVLRLASKQSMVAVYPDQKQNNSDKVEHQCTDHSETNAISPSHCQLSKDLEIFTDKYSSIIKLFSYEELCSATSNFMPVSIIGKGGSSEVYKGHLPDGREIAVKVLKSSEDAFKQFVSEIEIISSLHHKNVISLLGFSVDANNLLLVYDFLSRGSLEENLHGKNVEESNFGWKDRYKVALNVAQALKYLHDECDECADPIIHRDVKSSNILLSDSFEAQLADFGLAMHASESLHDMTTVDVAGTFGYLAPEYFMHGKVNDKIDVYAYGVILLELLSGRKPIDNGNPKGQESLVIWAKPIVKDGKVSELLDRKIADDYNEEEAERMVLAAYLCTRRAPELRPKISIVLELLEGETNTIIWAREQFRGSETGECDSKEIPANIQTHINLALMGLEDDDDSPYASSSEHNNNNISVEEYLHGRWSRSSSFD